MLRTSAPSSAFSSTCSSTFSLTFSSAFSSVLLALGVAFAGSALVACKKEPAPTSAAAEVGKTLVQGEQGGAAAGGSAAEQEARALFDGTCAICHGPSGAGDGAAAANLNPKPRNYTDKAWQSSVTDDDLRSIILQGGAAVCKSPTMPGQPQLKDKPEVVNALVAIIRGFGK